MANPSWPASLPQLVAVEGYGEAPPDTTLRSQMDAGPAKVRRRFTAGVRPLTLQLDLDGAQVETLDGFFEAILKGGALAFDWVHPRTQSAATLRFARPPAYRPGHSDAAWQALLELEILP
jgi:hypothetical protein